MSKNKCVPECLSCAVVFCVAHRNRPSGIESRCDRSSMPMVAGMSQRLPVVTDVRMPRRPRRKGETIRLRKTAADPGSPRKGKMGSSRCRGIRRVLSDNSASALFQCSRPPDNGIDDDRAYSGQCDPREHRRQQSEQAFQHGYHRAYRHPAYIPGHKEQDEHHPRRHSRL